ncbi:hypothetical protein [Rhodovulum sp. MB263]|uniref:hypothetical protein n=1 Tax=Rhodovulum sp. (strain MB263) TaxID=308754 RepID=UPI0009B78D86|nr:hypothetical protein [Rhodovulum sp. MB263]ARC88801.1 hypothetical protein B5V46_09305 [Rhodovulum sp. MB263]
MSAEITRKTRLVSANGGTLDIVSHDGEILGQIAVPAGAVPAAQYLGLVPEGCHLEVADGLAALNPRHRIGIQPHPHARETGANPDYVPTSATRLEREMRLTLARMQTATKRVEARERALSAIERVPQAPAEVPPVEEPPVEVIEDDEGQSVE